MGKTNRNSTMDIIKGMACIAVVLIHYNWSNDIGLFVKAICRFAVPYFFFVSGYYLLDSNGQITGENIKRKTLHIIDLLLKSGAFYLVFCILWNTAYSKDWSIVNYMQQKVTAANVIKFVVTNDPLVYDHFWYMLALVYCYLTVYLFRNQIKAKYCLPLSLLLMLGFTVLEEFSSVFPFRNAYRLGESGTYMLLSNTFLFRAMPFFLFGVFARKKNISVNGKVNPALLVAVCLLGCVIAAVEAVTVKSVQFFVGTYICVIALILITVSYPDLRFGILGFIGNKLSMNVYIYHIAVGKIFDLIAQRYNLWKNSVFLVTRPFCVLGTTLLAAWVMYLVSQWQKRLKQSRIETNS